jgi:hypothetical protein
MVLQPQVGDLVHVPQAVQLIDHTTISNKDPQLTIPLRVIVTDSPTVGVVTGFFTEEGYVRVFCDGGIWSVKSESLYPLKGRTGE